MENNETNPTPKKSSSTFATIAVLCVVAAAVLFFLKNGNLQSAKTTEKPATAASSVMNLEPFTVNLSDSEQKAYLRLGVDLGLQDEAKAKDAQASVAVVRDTILSALMATKPEDIATPEGKQKLKAQLLQAVQQRAPQLGVRELYFTDFLLQQ
jgi:flagellar FliL protein